MKKQTKIICLIVAVNMLLVSCATNNSVSGELSSPDAIHSTEYAVSVESSNTVDAKPSSGLAEKSSDENFNLTDLEKGSPVYPIPSFENMPDEAGLAEYYPLIFNGINIEELNAHENIGEYRDIVIGASDSSDYSDILTDPPDHDEGVDYKSGDIRIMQNGESRELEIHYKDGNSIDVFINGKYICSYMNETTDLYPQMRWSGDNYLIFDEGYAYFDLNRTAIFYVNFPNLSRKIDINPYDYYNAEIASYRKVFFSPDGQKAVYVFGHFAVADICLLDLSNMKWTIFARASYAEGPECFIKWVDDVTIAYTLPIYAEKKLHANFICRFDINENSNKVLLYCLDSKAVFSSDRARLLGMYHRETDKAYIFDPCADMLLLILDDAKTIRIDSDKYLSCRISNDEFRIIDMKSHLNYIVFLDAIGIQTKSVFFGFNPDLQKFYFVPM